MLRLLTFVALLASACRGTPDPPAPLPDVPATIRLESPAFEEGAPIPARYTCLGAGISPPMAWDAPPAGTESLVLTMERLETGPDEAAGAGTLLWVLFNLPPDATSLPEGAGGRRTGEAPHPLLRGVNHFGAATYDGPCPPAGDTARYAFRLHALRTRLAPEAGHAGALIFEAMAGHVLARGELTGTFGYE